LAYKNEQSAVDEVKTAPHILIGAVLKLTIPSR
jgi:hypothetical protein